MEPTIRGRRNSARNTEKWSRAASTMLVVVFVVLILGIIYYFYYSNTSRTPNNTSDAQRVTDTTPAPTASVAPSAMPTPTPSVAPTPTPTPTPLTTVKSLGTQAGVDVYEITNAPKLSVTVNITGKESWMSVQSVDAAGKRTTLFSGGKKNGETQTWDIDGSAIVRLGAASNVVLTVNGQSIPVGDLPNVKNFKFNFVKP